MSSQVFFTHLRNSGNLGDRSCCPRDYFPDFAQYRAIDCSEVDDIVPQGAQLIVGGGGLFMEHTVHKLQAWAHKYRLAIWGAGLNHSPRINDRMRQSLQDLFHFCNGPIGIRNPVLAEYAGVDYVPCVSCMRDEFSPLTEVYEADSRTGWKVLFYEHAHRRFAPEKGERMDNFSPDLNAVLAKFKEAEYVVTNSFHGAYWAQLMDRRVILWQPETFGNRFETAFENSIPIARSFGDLGKLIDEIVPRAGKFRSLRYRHLNRKFKTRILKWINEA